MPSKSMSALAQYSIDRVNFSRFVVRYRFRAIGCTALPRLERR